MSGTSEFGKMNEQELSEHAKFIDSTIASLLLDLKSGSKVKSNQASMRLDFWENKRFELETFLRKNHDNS
ncbi:hypothetical protein AYY19_04655 [Photobacterium aquimaris]|uniref:Uncharacterized protein n=1 Tax=Photobacterium aquimaris TaxID=512643 RepID=A0A2T3IGL9_9GAMM|nr:hypothetical protein [Photobacterium aquimaris]OBU15039.1 hypothetical protein AYY20_20560 [Photobacterium aquimaris]OBU16452.1 hypothetical protein AYY19_04655 [Photobacterium aquimaris]PSU26119.1 hypothetical protein CTM88_16845 [Photobacterium aquimaris]PSW02144.1 hypothetical protein CTM91_03415 [Photobacterium aquimaris]